MKDTTKNTVPKGSNNKRKRETTTDDTETTNSVPLKRVFGTALSDVTNLHPSVGRPIILTGQLSSLCASVVSETNNAQANLTSKTSTLHPSLTAQGSTTMRKRKPKNDEAEIIQPVFTSEASNIPLPRILSAPMDLPDADGYDSEEDGDELFQFDYDGNSDQYEEQEYDCSSEESGTESDSTISTMEETVPVLSRTKEPALRSGCNIIPPLNPSSASSTAPVCGP
ncbi:hypothetical protein Bca101_043526 [Brassica carinata]